jgi:molybdopterin-guanine dinucleotide biosynthesis protein MobB
MNMIPVYTVAAYSGTGKTTLLEKLIPELRRSGLRVAVVKHDAHDFDIDHKGKDSWRMTNAGAEVTAIVSGSKAAILENRPVSVESIIGKISDVDIILTEGYKHGPWPKIMLHRTMSGKPPALRPEECFAIVTDQAFECTVPCFGLTDIEGLAVLILKDLRKKKQQRSEPI